MSAAEWIFLASLAVLAYAYAGYALLIAAWARFAPRPGAVGPYQPAVAIVIVVRNGAAVIARKLDSCLAQAYPAGKLRVLVVSDGSDDATCPVVEARGDSRITLLAFPQRRGKAACLNDAIAACGEEVIVLTDARQPLEPSAVARLLARFADEAVGAVSGQLVFERAGMSGAGAGLDAYWRLEKRLRRDESAVHSSVGVTGALYALRRECFRPIPPETILDDVLIPMNVVLGGRRVLYEEAAIAWDTPSASFVQERTRKIRTLAGNFQLLFAHPRLLAPWRNPIALQFVSHKVMRLAAPFAMVLALASNVALAGEGGLYVATLAVQSLCYAMAAVGLAWPAARRLPPVRLAATFLSLNWFVVAGLVEYLTNPGAHLWKGTAPPPRDPDRVAGT